MTYCSCNPSIEPSAASTGKNIPGLMLLDQSWNILQILLVIDDIAWKKLRYTLKGCTQAKLFWHFPFIYFISLQAEKNFTACTCNLRQNSYSYLLLKLQLFAFVKVLVSFWQTGNNNEATKRIILKPPRQTSKKFLNYCVNGMLLQRKKYMWNL